MIVDVAVSPAANQFYSMHRDVAPDLYAPDPEPNSAPTSPHSAAEDACSDDENLELQEALDLVQAKMKSCHDQDVAPVLAFAREMNRIEVSEAAQRFSYVAKTPKRRKLAHGAHGDPPTTPASRPRPSSPPPSLHHPGPAAWGWGGSQGRGGGRGAFSRQLGQPSDIGIDRIH